MKIVYLVSHLIGGGAERTVTYLSDYTSKIEGVDVTVLSVSGSDEIFYKLGDKVKLITLGVPQSEKNVFDRLKKAILRFTRVRRAIKKLKPDVVFCMIASTAKFLPKTKKFKVICSERTNPKFVTDKKMVRERDAVLKSCDGVVFQTKRAKEFFPKSIQDKGVVIPNAVGNPYAYNVESVTERKKTITAVGRINKVKDYPTLIKAFSIVNKKYPNYVLEIYGDGPEKDKLIELSINLGILENVKFLGVKRDAVVEVSKSSCYVLCSLYEGMPNALMEAMAVGAPCVATDCPFGPKELITDKENGLLVEVGDVEGLANAICKFIEDKELANKCSQNARKILETNSVDIIAKKYYDYICNIVNS